jgi:Uma2 family endonuclease
MGMNTRAIVTIEDLRRVEGKAEIVNGEIIAMSPTGAAPGTAGFRITASLDAHTRRTGRGRAVPDNVAFRVDLPHRQSFSPDAAFYVGPDPDMEFFTGAPLFAAEVRSKADYGPVAEEEMAAKRRDYFAAGTLVVWDVDLLSPEVVRVYSASDPEHPRVHRRGQSADAEPAVPDWTMPVDDLFL